MILQKSSPPDITSRFVLHGVPRVGYYMGGQRCPEDVPYPSCLRACLDYLGENLGYRLICSNDTTWRLDNTYTYIMGVSGSAFRLSWRPGWHGDNVEIMYMSDDPAAPFQRAFDAVGYELIIVDAEGRHDNEQLYREAIIRSLCERGRPVIAFGVIGPPEACLVTGYDEGGDVLIGWNFFQDFPEFNAGVEKEPTGEFRKRDWFANVLGMAVFGEKKQAPARDIIYRQALEWALKVMRTPVTFGDLENGGRHNGVAAFQAWADHLLRDDQFPDDLEVLRERFMVHDDAVGMVAEGRWYAAKFMEFIADNEPTLEQDLLAAAACFEIEHDLMWQIWGMLGGNGRSDNHVRKLADPAARRAIARLILQSRDQDCQAAAYIEQALNR